MDEAPTRPSRARPVAPPPASRRAKLWAAFAAVVALGAIALVFFVFRAKEHERVSLPIDIPVSRPTGDPIHVRYAVKAGDIFITEGKSTNRILSTIREDVDTSNGMQFDARSTVGHQVFTEDGLQSRVLFYLDRVDTQIPSVRDQLWGALGNRAFPYAVRFARGPDGHPLPGHTVDKMTQLAPGRRLAVDSVLSGLSDLATNWLPPHDVRVGEVWDVASVSDVMPRVEILFRGFAQRPGKPDGYPAVVSKAVLQVVAREPHEGEDCLRLRIAALMEMNGDTVLPAYPGWITGAATIDGFIWVSVDTGIVWGVDAKSSLVSNYRNEVLPPRELRSEGTITSLTHRSTSMP
jgi:hypothetical protein